MFGDYLNTVISVLSGIRVMDIVDIAIVAFAIYKIIDFIRKTRAQQLLKGLLILVCDYVSVEYIQSLHCSFPVI